MKIYTGTSGYDYEEWKGLFYPDKIPRREFLRFYSENLAAVEINNTFYRMPTATVLSFWAAQVPPDFLFAIKAPRLLTHVKRLRNVEEESAYFFQTLSILERKLGPVLWQFPAYFRADVTVLRTFLDLVPPTVCSAFEFRGASPPGRAVIDLFRERNCSFCTTDSDNNPALEVLDTADWGYLRLRRSDYTDADLKNWMKRILSRNWRRAFVFFKHEGEAKGPQTAMHFRGLVEEFKRSRTATGENS